MEPPPDQVRQGYLHKTHDYFLRVLSMNVRELFGILLSASVVASTPASAAYEVVPFEGYTLVYEAATKIGALDFTREDALGAGFGWTLPPEFAFDYSTNFDANAYGAPFYIFVNEGFKFSGKMSVHLGNISFAEAGAWTAPDVSGAFQLDGDYYPFFVPMMRTEIISTESLRAGYYDLTYRRDVGFDAFSNLALTDFSINLGIADPGAVIFSNGQAELSFWFGVTPVPEPSTYALLMAGLGVVALRSSRRTARAAFAKQ